MKDVYGKVGVGISLKILRDLRLDEDATRNRSIFNRLKKHDILLIPQLPFCGEVALLGAKEDQNKGYVFEIYESYYTFDIKLT